MGYPYLNTDLNELCNNNKYAYAPAPGTLPSADGCDVASRILCGNIDSVHSGGDQSHANDWEQLLRRQPSLPQFLLSLQTPPPPTEGERVTPPRNCNPTSSPGAAPGGLTHAPNSASVTPVSPAHIPPPSIPYVNFLFPANSGPDKENYWEPCSTHNSYLFKLLFPDISEESSSPDHVCESTGLWKSFPTADHIQPASNDSVYCKDLHKQSVSSSHKGARCSATNQLQRPVLPQAASSDNILTSRSFKASHFSTSPDDRKKGADKKKVAGTGCFQALWRALRRREDWTQSL